MGIPPTARWSFCMIPFVKKVRASLACRYGSPPGASWLSRRYLARNTAAMMAKAIANGAHLCRGLSFSHFLQLACHLVDHYGVVV